MSHPAALAASALKQIFQALGRLTEEELTDLAEGRVRVQLTARPALTAAGATPTRSRSKAKVDVERVAETIRDLHTTEEIEAYLEENDKVFTVSVLKEIAKALGPTVSKAGTRKADIKQNIVRGTIGFRQSSAMVGTGAYLA
ncbi:hypothetical protein RB614_29005 [Phytohabitans sp. ZYX-F-186]|uniref:DNA-binding protein n=1 Tax=Phytohabitans maris TaxID=3071409 RepID=A0ABU0ZNG0_9ACTN|nr:hypothetical protein [Phytohabitans sp. ZYX-F-186]MDQ7908577.1 hypothetical protein [Phytohabitans sp. ZYX-F-186]